jgi:hypothetical protein
VQHAHEQQDACDLDDLRLQLHIHRVRRAELQIVIRVVGVEIARIEIDPHPWAFHRADDIENVLRFGHDAAMIFESEINPALAGVLGAFLDGANAKLFRLLLGNAVRRAGENPDVRRAHDAGVINPLFDGSDFRGPLFAGRNDKVISHRRAADSQPAQKGMLPQPNQVVRIKVFREVITGDLRAVAAVIGAVIEELKHVDPPGGVGFLVAGVIRGNEEIAERVSRETEPQAGRAGAFERFDREDAGGRPEGGSGETGELQKTASIHGVVHKSSKHQWRSKGTKFLTAAEPACRRSADFSVGTFAGFPSSRHMNGT